MKPTRFQPNGKKQIQKVFFSKIIETERAQLLLVIKPLKDGSAEVSAITFADGGLHNKKTIHTDFHTAQTFVSMYSSSKALNTIQELNGENYDKGWA